ncbi:hypothetical protein LDO26_13360 [Luteimonas sp. BDR2-5]|uniref:hypothetical protein n=1 Tax=Proluteimonas luteida TaxID=2878685 RepID=UPI001E4782E0|nr:hypothetical protein [Luteimonas sp. BDR2-5]MCD9029187.1 hypothetical protein [Luteimonas sp. BDR2-5]
MKNAFHGPEELNTALLESSQRLMESCDGCLLPFDTYCMSAALRSMDTVRAYAALAEIDNFNGCCILTRSQLDSLVRLNRVLLQPTPHTLAQQLTDGEKLRRIKGSEGKKLTDGYLVELLARNNPWISPAYELLNESVHLSPLHYKSMMAQGLHQQDGVVRIQYMGDSSHVKTKDKVGLNTMFLKTTKGTASLLRYWASRRTNNADTQAWRAKAEAAGAI